MTNQEMRELDAWIAENVMELDVSKYPINHERVDIDTRSICYWIEDIPSYTTDPAAAMMVLEKCVKKMFMERISITRKDDGFAIRMAHMNWDWIFADTLPLAICVFAKKLFSCNQTS